MQKVIYTLTTLAVLTTASLSAQTTVGFTSGEGYVDGAISDNANWTENTAGAWQVDATAGTLTTTSNNGNFNNAILQVDAPSLTEQIFRADFRFTAPYEPSTGGEFFRFGTSRNGQNSYGTLSNTAAADSFFINVLENVGSNSSATGISLTGADFGLIVNGTNDGYVNSTSDLIRFDFTSTYTGTGNLFDTTLVVTNLNTDTVIGTVTHSGWDSANGYKTNPKQLDVNNARIGDFDATSISIESLSIIPEPSAFAAFAGALALGLVVIRRRR